MGEERGCVIQIRGTAFPSVFIQTMFDGRVRFTLPFFFWWRLMDDGCLCVVGWLMTPLLEVGSKG